MYARLHKSANTGEWQIVVLGSLTATILLSSQFQDPKWRGFRVAVFVCTGLSAFAPITHALLLYGPQRSMNVGLPYYLAEGAIIVLAAFIYEVRCFSCWSSSSILCTWDEISFGLPWFSLFLADEPSNRDKFLNGGFPENLISGDILTPSSTLWLPWGCVYILLAFSRHLNILTTIANVLLHRHKKREGELDVTCLYTRYTHRTMNIYK